MKGITNLPKPTLKNGVVAGVPDPTKVLVPTNDFIAFQRGDGRKYMWDNYFTAVKDAPKEGMEYRGHRLRS